MRIRAVRLNRAYQTQVSLNKLADTLQTLQRLGVVLGSSCCRR